MSLSVNEKWALMSGISIEEGLEGTKDTKFQSRASRSSITRKSFTDNNGIEMKESYYNDSGKEQKTRSGSLSSLSSRGSTMSWFRKRSRNQERGI